MSNRLGREFVIKEIAAHQKRLTPHFESEHRVLHKDGSFRWMLSEGSRFTTVRNASRMGGSQTDITEGKVSDPLTACPIACCFIDRVGRLIKHTKRRKDIVRGSIHGLDGFKMVNDSVGHLIGDQLLLGVPPVGEVFGGPRIRSRV